jgi:hypothetical protein
VTRRTTRRGRGDDGQVSILVIGFALIAFSLIAVVVDATAVHLARSQLTDAADAAALDAADALGGEVYTGGIAGAAVPVTDSSVRAQATTYLSTYTPPRRLDAIALGDATGSADGLSGRVRLPIGAAVLRSFRDGITVTVTSTARATLR